MKHTRTVKHYNGSQAQLVEEVGDLYYDAMAELLAMMAEKIARDAVADQRRGRVKLAAELDGCAQHLRTAAQHIQTAWRICEPNMRQSESDQGSRLGRP